MQERVQVFLMITDKGTVSSHLLHGHKKREHVIPSPVPTNAFRMSKSVLRSSLHQNRVTFYISSQFDLFEVTFADAYD